MNDLRRAAGFLDSLLADLYQRSTLAPNARPPSSIVIIDDPAEARRILARPEIFVKNYAFLDDLATGRFSANGKAWRERAALTRDWYRNAHRNVDSATVRSIYARHLEAGDTLYAPALFDRFVLSAVAIFSQAIGLRESLAWPADLVSDMRDALRLRQWIDWNGCDAATLAHARRQLIQQRDALRAAWQASAEVAHLLAQLQAGGMPISDFDAVEELVQNLLASSETTASSLLWAAEALSQQPALQQQLADAACEPDKLDRFIAEVLRLFPPVPYLTRRCTVSCDLAGTFWQKGAVLSISIVGIHRHPAYWRAPACFDIDRPEFGNAAMPAAYLPFSRGERVCAGIRLAQLELRAALEALLAGRHCIAGTQATHFGYGLSSFPKTSLRAIRRLPA